VAVEEAAAVVAVEAVEVEAEVAAVEAEAEVEAELTVVAAIFLTTARRLRSMRQFRR
jgi:hypothetical protein